MKEHTVDSSVLPEGTYRLRAGVPAPAPDKRKRHDWRARGAKAGDLFVVTTYFVDPKAPRWLVTYPSGEYAHYSVRLHEHPELVELLEPVQETPSLWLAREHNGLRITHGILDRLVADGTVTLDQVKAAATAYLEDIDP